MPANIFTYIGREAAWHKLGTVTGKHMTWAEVQANGGLDYVVFKSQLHDGLGRPGNHSSRLKSAVEWVERYSTRSRALQGGVEYVSRRKN